MHDQYAADGGDGYWYRTWHPQVDPSGCVFAHEHGDNPNSTESDEIRASLAERPIRFAYIAHRMPMPGEPNGHEEPHEGFKVFVANRGDVNDEVPGEPRLFACRCSTWAPAARRGSACRTTPPTSA